MPSHMDLWTVCSASSREMNGMNEGGKKKSLLGSDEAAPGRVCVRVSGGGLNAGERESFISGKDIQLLLSRLFRHSSSSSSVIIFPLLHFRPLASPCSCLSGRIVSPLFQSSFSDWTFPLLFTLTRRQLI